MKTIKLKIGLMVIALLLWQCNNSVEYASKTILTKAPFFELTSTNGAIISSNDYKGKFVVLHIATTWCPYCNAEAPHLQEIYETYKAKNVEVLIIDVKEPKELVEKKLVEHFNLEFPVLLDTNGCVAASFAPENILPELARDEIMLASNLLIDTEGNIQFMSLLDTKNFDVTLKELTRHLDVLLDNTTN